MPIYNNPAKHTVKSTFAGLANEFIYSENAENAISNGVNKFNNSLFGEKSSTYLDVTVTPSSLPTVQDCNYDFINEAGTKAGFVKNLTGLYELSSYEASINHKHGNVTYQAFATLDGSVGAGIKFKNGDRISSAYTIGSGAEIAYSTNTTHSQTKTGLFYDQNRNSFGASSVFQTQANSRVSFGGGASIDTKGNWSATMSTSISQQNSNIKLNAGIQNDAGTKAGFIGAIITF